MAFTINQQRAIDLKDQNITVAASAGSGKTTVLVERILKRVIEDRIPLDRILAMTFTEAAASEMKGRLFVRLSAALDDPKYDKSFIEEQLVLLQKAQISTIHAFCLSIIKENYAFIGFDVDRLNNIITIEDEQHYINKALDDTLNKFEGDSSFTYFRQCLSNNVNDLNPLRAEIIATSELLQEISYADLLALNKATYTIKRLIDLPSVIKNALFEMLKDYTFFMEECLDKLIIISENEPTLLARKQYIEQMYVSINNYDYANFLQQFFGFVNVRYELIKGNEDFQEQRDILRKLENYLLEILYDEDIIIKDLNTNYPHLEGLIKMGNYFNMSLENYKQDATFMDFNDMEYYAIKLLSSIPEVAQAYSEKFIDIMVDEYQDSSINQDRMLSYISNGHNIFRVGDVKQSIYRFRNALPDLLKNYIDNPGANDAVIFLQENFRSNSQIIEFVNEVFAKFMNLKTFKSNFNNADIALVGDLKTQENHDNCIEYHVINKNTVVNEKSDSFNTIRANYIAQLIIEKQKKLNYKWSDFVVLVRSNERKIDLKQSFENYGVPSFIDSREGFYKGSVVSYISTYLNMLVNPFVDLYFVGICLSPFYEFSDNEIASIKILMNQKNITSFYNYFKENTDHKYQALIHDIEAINQIDNLRDKLIYIYQINGLYDDKCSSYERTNLDLLLEKACSYEKNNTGGIVGYCAYIDSLMDFKSSEALSINSDEDVVRVMTIHQSKGLQFKYVIYWGKEQSSVLLEDYVLKSSQLGLGIDYFDNEQRLMRQSLLRLAIKHQNTKADIEEEIRVIYVALTRAKEKLVLTTCLTANEIIKLDTQQISAYSLLSSGNFSKWLYKMAKDLSHRVKIYEISKIDSPTKLAKKHQASFTINKLPPLTHHSLKLTPSNHQARLSGFSSNKKATALGTATHQLLESLDFTKTYTLNSLKDLCTSQSIKLADKINYESIMDFLNHPLTKEFVKGSTNQEYNFIYRNPQQQIIHGIIDLLVEMDDIIYIVDFKSDHHTNRELYINTYQEQLRIYQEAIKNTTNKPIKCLIFALTLKDYIHVL